MADAGYLEKQLMDNGGNKKERPRGGVGLVTVGLPELSVIGKDGSMLALGCQRRGRPE